MVAFLHRLIQPEAILLLFVVFYSLWIHIFGGYAGVRGPERTYGSLAAFLCWLLLLVISVIAWLFLVAS